MLTQPFFMRKAQTFSSPGFVITQSFHQFFVEKERFGWECKDENVTLP